MTRAAAAPLAPEDQLPGPAVSWHAVPASRDKTISVLLRCDAVDTVAELKAQPGGDLRIIGSASLVRSLHAAALIDRYTLVIYPLTLGSGARLFESPARSAEFELTGSVATTKGMIIAQYARR